jgi:hypothetical protein
MAASSSAVPGSESRIGRDRGAGNYALDGASARMPDGATRVIVGIVPDRGAPPMSDHHLLTSRELDSRVSAGLHVRLLWDEADGSLAVAVVDRVGDDAFVIPVPGGVPPLDVFYHPHAYTA